MKQPSVVVIALLSALAACGGQKAVEGGECSAAEQALFLACLDAGCSASYTEDLGAADSCAVDGGGSIITVEAGASCGFTSSGSCFVLCDCPEGVGVEVEVGQGADGADAEDVSVLESAVQAVEDAVGALTEAQGSAGADIDALAERLAALEAAHAAEVAARDAALAAQVAETAALRAELEAAQELLAEVDARTAGGLVVSEYEIYCTSVAGVGLEEPAVLTRPYMYNRSDLSAFAADCIIANIDPNDRPFWIIVETLRDRVLEAPPYSSADSIARYGEDLPGRYDLMTSFGNDVNYEHNVQVVGATSYGRITETGDVVISDSALPMIQNDMTLPGSPSRSEIPVRVIIFHDRPYAAPVYP